MTASHCALGELPLFLPLLGVTLVLSEYDHPSGNVDPRQMTRKAAWYSGEKMGWEDEMKCKKKCGERPLSGKAGEICSHPSCTEYQVCGLWLVPHSLSTSAYSSVKWDCRCCLVPGLMRRCYDNATHSFWFGKRCPGYLDSVQSPAACARECSDSSSTFPEVYEKSAVLWLIWSPQISPFFFFFFSSRDSQMKTCISECKFRT